MALPPEPGPRQTQPRRQRTPTRRVLPQPRLGGNLRSTLAQQAQQGGQQAQVDPAAEDIYDFNTDPILLRIRSLATMRRQDAEAEATRLRSQLDVEYGYGEAGQVNPFSRLAKLAEQEKRAPRELDERLGANLFYGGHRATKQTELAKSLLEARAGIEGSYREARSGIESSLRDALMGTYGEELEGEEEAAARRQQTLGELPVSGRPRPALAAGPLAPSPRSALVAAVRRRPAAPRRTVRRPGYREQ